MTTLVEAQPVNLMIQFATIFIIELGVARNVARATFGRNILIFLFLIKSK